MTHAVVVLNKVAATDVDAFNRAAISHASASTEDIDNGWVFELLTKSTTTGEGEVWLATKNTTTTITNLWMAYSPEIVTVVSGSNQFKGIDNDPRNFYNINNQLFDAFKPQIGDVITLTADALDSSTPQAYAIAVSSTFKLTWNGSPVSGLSLKYLETTYISLPQAGAISETQHVAAFKFVVTAI